MRQIRVTFLVLVLLPIFGCGKKPLITGEVFDGFGLPLRDAAVSVEGTTFKTLTDSSGKYAVEYVPGNVRVRITREGYTPADLFLNIASASTYPSQQVTLYKIPPQQGVFLFGQSDYIPLARGRINQQIKTTEIPLNDPDFYSKMATYGGDKYEDLFTALGDFTSVPIGIKLRFLAKDEQNKDAQPLFRLENDGLILSREYLVSSHKDKSQMLSYEEKQLGNGIVLREVTLDKGKYAFVTVSNAVRQGQDSIGSGISLGRSNPFVEPIYIFEVGQNTEQKAEAPSPSSPSPTSASTTRADTNSVTATSFSKSFEGTINDKIGIEMEIRINGNSITGSYFYKKYHTPITLNGTIDQQLNVTLAEYDKGSNKTGEFKGKLGSTRGTPDYSHPANNDRMEGTWSNPNGNKTMKFFVLEKK